MRTYYQLVSAIIHAMPRKKEIAALSDEQIQTLRKYGNTFDNVLYMQTCDWKERRAANLPALASPANRGPGRDEIPNLT